MRKQEKTTTKNADQLTYKNLFKLNGNKNSLNSLQTNKNQHIDKKQDR